MEQDRDPVVTALANALVFLTGYVDEREVPDEIADDDVKALEIAVSYLQEVPDAMRPRLVAILGHPMAYMCGFVAGPPE